MKRPEVSFFRNVKSWDRRNAFVVSALVTNKSVYVNNNNNKWFFIFPPFFSNSSKELKKISKNSIDHERDSNDASLSPLSYLQFDPPRAFGATAATVFLNWCFSAVFEATKPAYRAMADISVSESVYRVECVFFFFFFFKRESFFCVELERVLKRDGEKGQSSTHPKKASSSVLRERKSSMKKSE